MTAAAHPPMTRSDRWTLVVVAAVAVLVVALVVELGDDRPTPAGRPSAQAARAHRDADTPEALAGPRQRADLPPCPAGGQDPGPEQLRGIVVECAADGATVDVARALAGRTGGAEPVGLLVRAVRRGIARDGRIPAAGR